MRGLTLRNIAIKHHGWVAATFPQQRTPLEALALVASEVGEAANECRGASPTPAFGPELADIVLRVMDLAINQGLDLEAEIMAKMAVNEARGSRGRLK